MKNTGLGYQIILVYNACDDWIHMVFCFHVYYEFFQSYKILGVGWGRFPFNFDSDAKT